MSWKNNISEGFNRVSIALGFIAAIIFGLFSWVVNEGNIFYTIIFAVVGYWLGRGLVILINWIVNGFIGK